MLMFVNMRIKSMKQYLGEDEYKNSPAGRANLQM